MADQPMRTVIDFLNTVDVEEGTDVLDDPAAWRDWVRSTLGTSSPTDALTERDTARDLRDHLRTLASGAEPAESQRIPVQIELDGTSGARLEADTVVGRVASAVAQLAFERRWNRVKICPADDCRWAFYDESRNHSRQWCSMRVCGNRAKARTHRQRTEG